MNEVYDMLEIIIRMNKALRDSEEIQKAIVKTIEEIEIVEGKIYG